MRVIWPLAAALDIEPSALIAGDTDTVSDLYCVRANARRSIPVKSEGIAKALLSPPAGAYTHPGHEFGFVLAGEIELTVDSSRYVLKAGDSFAFKSTLPHAFCNSGAEPCQILWVNATKPSEVRDGA